MKKTLLILIMLIPTLLVAKNHKTSDSFWDKHIDLGAAVGTGISTNGLGISATGKINERFKVRLSYEFLKLNISEQSYVSGTHQYNANPKVKTGGFSAMFDASLYKSFYVSLGVVQTNVNVDVDMVVKDALKFGDIELTDVGDYKVNFEPRNKVAPYMALGWEPKFMANKQLGINFEIGAYYINSFNATSNGTGLFGTANGSDEAMRKTNDELKNMSWTKFYPVTRIGVSYYFF